MNIRAWSVVTCTCHEAKYVGDYILKEILEHDVRKRLAPCEDNLCAVAIKSGLGENYGIT